MNANRFTLSIVNFPFFHFMSYQVIARKWRPQTFEEVTGQENITQTLRNALEFDRLHHAYLFSGARGVGKTTTARLLAKALNCHKTNFPNPQPCSFNDPEACPSCCEISESRSIDVLEFDAASHTGVQEIRDIILEGINVAAARDRYKVFIIDEVHMLSANSFNALLKTVEEPPPNVVFIMATTELHKVPETILSRCQEFEFRTISLQKIYERLKLIAESEKIDVSDEALREIARSGEGSMRDAQSNFDQVISFSGEKISVADVANALGMASVEMLTKVLTAIADKNAKLALDVVDDLTARGHDLRNFSRDLLSVFRDLLVFKIAGDTENLFETAVLSLEAMKNHAASFSEADFLRFFNSLAETETKLKDATQSRYVLEVGLIKLIEMRRVTTVENLLDRLAKLEQSFGNVQPDFVQTAVEPLTAVAEKKTLSIHPASEEIAIPREDNSPEEETTYFTETPNIDSEEPQAKYIPVPKQSSGRAFDNGFIESLRLALPDIDSQELEHVDDPWLDNAFDEMLLQSGDDLLPIRNILKSIEPTGTFTENVPVSNGLSHGAAAAPALSKTFPTAPVFDNEQPRERTVLAENATEEELFAYAEKHPAIRKALRIFGGKLVEVKKL